MEDAADMETALDIFRLMMREEIAPGIRRMGFKGSGQSFILPSETHWVLLGFQKSTTSNANAVRFTVNVTAASKRAWTQAQSEHSYLGERPGANISYGDFAWQRRIGQLIPDGRDTWWTITTRASTESAKVEVLEAIRIYALPAMSSNRPSGLATADSEPGGQAADTLAPRCFGRMRLASLTLSDQRRRRDLLRVLTSPSKVRADFIRQLHERPDRQKMADLLIFLEEWEWARQGMIEELSRA